MPVYQILIRCVVQEVGSRVNFERSNMIHEDSRFVSAIIQYPRKETEQARSHSISTVKVNTILSPPDTRPTVCNSFFHVKRRHFLEEIKYFSRKTYTMGGL